MMGHELKDACEITRYARNCWRRCRREGRMARGRLPLASIGIAAFLTLTPVAVGGRSAAAAPGLSNPVKTVALLSVQFLNDHEDLEPTTAAERARLASIAELFKSMLEASARYKFASIPFDATAKIAAGPEIGNCGGASSTMASNSAAILPHGSSVRRPRILFSIFSISTAIWPTSMPRN